jgi:hypothetical protein
VGTFVTTAVVTQPGEYLVVLSTTRPAEQGGGSVNVGTGTTTPHFNINPGLGLKATFFNVPSVSGVGDVLLTGAPNGIAVRLTDTLGAYTNVWDGTGRLTGTLGGVTFPTTFNQRDPQLELHSGWFDLASTTATLPVAGRYTFNLFHAEAVDLPTPHVVETPFRSYTGNRVVDAAAKPILNVVSPSVTLATLTAWTLRADGAGFTANSRIVLNGTTQATTRFISSSTLTVELVGTPPGTLNVQVVSNTTKGVYSLPIPVTIVDPLKVAFITLQNLPTQVIAGSSVPTFMITVTDSATGLPLNLINPSGRWWRKGKADVPFVLIPTGAVGVYSVMCTQPNITEAGAYIPEIKADNAIAVRFTPQYPYMTVLGSDLTSIKIEEFLSSPAPLYRDILPGYRQGDTLQRFLVRGYDQYRNLTAIPNGLALHRAQTTDAEELTIPLTTRTIWNGVMEVSSTPLDSAGTFTLMLTDPAPALALKAGGSVTSAVPLLDESGKPLSTLFVLPIEGEEDRFPKRPLSASFQPILLCANPYIVPTRAPSTQKIDPSTTTNHPEALTRFGLDYSGGGKKSYSLIWSDEFDGAALDNTKWTIRGGANNGSPNFRYGTKKDANNVVVNNGVLQLFMRKLASIETNNIQYSDAFVDSRYKADFRYGKFVIKVKVPNVPFMHHGVWMGSSEDGSAQLEADFPDCGNSPFPVDDDVNPNIKGFSYTYNNNKHPRMALAIPRDDGNPYAVDTQAQGDFSCAAPADSSGALGLGGDMVEREYWMEWDRDSQGGYVKMGVTPMKADGTPDDARSQTIKWWGLHNAIVGSAQFIPDGKPRPIGSATLGRYIRAARQEAPFNNYPTWFYDYFPMNIVLDVKAFYGWAGDRCNPDYHSTDPDNNLYSAESVCTDNLTQLDNLLSTNGGKAMEVDYVRVYQRDASALTLKPLILSGAHFTKGNTVVRLYKTMNDQDEFIELETRPWSHA